MKKLVVFTMVFGALLLVGCLGQPEQPVNETENETPVVIAPKECFGPVCGVDGLTYETDCLAGELGVAVAHTGECEEPPECEDSDDGINLEESGTVSKGDLVKEDYCGENGNIYEYSCSNNEILLSTMSCPENSTCIDGACVIEQIENQTTNVTNVTGLSCIGPEEQNIFVKETLSYENIEYEDVCVTASVVKDYYCENDSMKTINAECPGAHECRDGACIEMEKLCQETDEGEDLTKRGNIKVVRGIMTILDEWDECVDDGSVNEWYCAENGSAILEEIWCGSEKKCKDGRCIRSTCDEEDEGIDIFARGEVEIDGHIDKDYCISDERVMEYYCYGESIRGEGYDCPEGFECIAGECRID